MSNKTFVLLTGLTGDPGVNYQTLTLDSNSNIIDSGSVVMPVHYDDNLLTIQVRITADLVLIHGLDLNVVFLL